MAGEDDIGELAARIAALEDLVERLVARCRRLREENEALRNQQRSLMAERASLIERNERARSRVEAMIAHLRSMEEGS